MYIGYERVSPDDQNLSLQEDTLKEPSCERIIYEKVSGANLKRSGLKEALGLLCGAEDVFVR